MRRRPAAVCVGLLALAALAPLATMTPQLMELGESVALAVGLVDVGYCPASPPRVDAARCSAAQAAVEAAGGAEAAAARCVDGGDAEACRAAADVHVHCWQGGRARREEPVKKWKGACPAIAGPACNDYGCYDACSSPSDKALGLGPGLEYPRPAWPLAVARGLGPANPDRPNIVLVIVDTLSRPALAEFAPDLLQFLTTDTDTHEAFEMRQYSTVNFATTTTHVPMMFTGRMSCQPAAKEVDGEKRLVHPSVDADWLFRAAAREAGYHTVLGSRRFSSLYSARPSVHDLWGELLPDLTLVAPRFDLPADVGGRSQLEHALWAFKARMGRGAPVWGLFHSLQAHHVPSYAAPLRAQMEAPLRAIMREHPNTAIVVLSDHGQKLLGTHWEPFWHMLLPRRMETRAASNRDRVVTALDVYATLHDLALGRPPPLRVPCRLRSHRCPRAMAARRESVLRPIPASRSRADAGISLDHYVCFTPPTATLPVAPEVVHAAGWADHWVAFANAHGFDRAPDRCPQLRAPRVASAELTQHEAEGERVWRLSATLFFEPDPEFELVAYKAVAASSSALSEEAAMAALFGGERKTVFEQLVPVGRYAVMEACAPRVALLNGFAFTCFCHVL